MFFSSSDDSENCSIARLDLFDIGFGLVTQNSLQVEDNTRHIRTNESKRTMFQFA